MSFLQIALLLILALLAYVRFAPSSVDRFHVAPQVSKDEDLIGGAKRIISGTTAEFQSLDEVARATPRTTVLAGSVEDGMVTYITRSFAIGFPDYTTVKLSDAGIEIFARLRFGRSDLGVNAKRVNGWINALSAD